MRTETGKIIYLALGMGLLTGKFGAEGPFPEARKQRFEALDKAQLKDLLATVKKLADKYNKQMSAIALNWCIAKGTIPLAGARTAEHVRQNQAALGFLLTDEEIAELDKFAFEGYLDKEWLHG